MPDSQLLIAFFASAAVFAYAPGPSTLYAAAQTIAGGRNQGLQAAFGIHLGGYFHVAIVAMGVASLTSSLPSIANADATDTAALDALNKFFNALSVDNYESGALKNQVTDDFIIFEMGQRFTLAQFKTFLASANYKNWKSTQWTISDATVTSVNGMTHISYKNTGVFVFPSQDSSAKLTEQRNIWLESALLVVDGEQLKLKFLQSENIFREETVLGSQ